MSRGVRYDFADDAGLRLLATMLAVWILGFELVKTSSFRYRRSRSLSDKREKYTQVWSWVWGPSRELLKYGTHESSVCDV